MIIIKKISKIMKNLKKNKIINITHTEKYLKDKNIDKDLDNNDKKGYQIINNNENNFINNNNKIFE